MENTITIPFELPDVKVIGYEVDNKGNLIITVESTKEGCRCSRCGKHITNNYGHGTEKIIRHTSVFGMKTYIKIRPLRYQCPICTNKPTTTQILSWQIMKSPHTIEYEQHVLLQLVNTTVSDVAIKEGLGYDAVEGIIERYIDKQINWASIDDLEIIGIDDFSIKKGRTDRIAIVTRRDGEGNQQVLGLLKDYKKATVKAFLKKIPKRLKKTVKYICTDLYEGFIKAGKEVFSNQVKIVADRFHVAKLYRESVDKLRKEEMKRLEKELDKEQAKEVKKLSYLIRKSILNEQEQLQLDKVFRLSPALKSAHELSTHLTEIFNQPLSVEEAEQKVRQWLSSVKQSGLSCFNTFVGTLKKHKKIILNYFIGRHNSGFVEGLNNKLRVMKRRCYGILNLEHWFQRLTIDLNGYRLFLKNN